MGKPITKTEESGVQVYIPNIDTNILQEKVNECALKGALKVIEEYYTGYNSPYMEALKQALKDKEVSIHFDIPDILAVINDSISSKFDQIANQAVASTYIPYLSKMLTRVDQEIKLSDLLQEFISCYEIKEYDHFSCLSLQIERNSYSYDIPTVNILFDGCLLYSITLSKAFKEKDKYTILGMPSKKYDLKEENKYSRFSTDTSFTTKLLDDRELKISTPVTQNILADNFFSYLISLKINDTKIVLDCSDFDEDWLPSDDND